MGPDAIKRIEQDVKARFPEGAVREVVLLAYGENPAIEPGRVWIRVVIDPGTPEGGQTALEAFHEAHRVLIKQLGHDLPGLLPEATRIEFVDGEDSIFLISTPPEEGAAELTPVMARLGAADLETLDTLIAAGIAPNRAEAVRWTLARIRERPAYGQLRERGREIEELKAQF
ncbi:MAG TPA: hypothetical protein VEH55_06845 [Gaiellaceae bacterium]|nr:hypothetical protein [Gaiellaceae bacterium]